MRTRISLLILLLILGGTGYYIYKYGLTRPAWMQSLFGSSSDAATTTKVKTSLSFSKRLSGFDIGVNTSNGIVTLTGQVPSEDLKSFAAEIARDTEGVSEVQNEIAVNQSAQPSGESIKVEDLEIRAAILESLARSPELGGKNIDVKVENRTVRLSGTVDTPAQKNGAEQTARAVSGVAGITNDLAVANPQAGTEPPAVATQSPDPTMDLARRVEFELFTTRAFDISQMTIREEGGTVTLGGRARSLAEKLLAERVAQSTPGVRKVVNELQVTGGSKQ